MPASIACPSCSARLNLPDQLPEQIKVLRCPQCKAGIPLEQLPSLRAKPAAQTRVASSTELADDSMPNLEIPDEEELVETEAEELVAVEAAEEEDELVDVEAAEEEELVEVEMGEMEVEVMEEEEEEPRKLRGLLGRQEFILRSKFGLVNLKYDVLDGHSKKKIGTALEETSALRHMVGMGMFGRGTRKDVANHLVLRDNKDRVWAVIKRTAYLLRPRIEIRDDEDRLLGYLKGKLLAGFTIYDDKDELFANGKVKWGKLLPKAYAFCTGKGKELGNVTYEALKTGKSKASFGQGKNWYVTMKDSVADDRDTKLLLLASAIAFDMWQIASAQKNRGGA